MMTQEEFLVRVKAMARDAGVTPEQAVRALDKVLKDRKKDN